MVPLPTLRGGVVDGVGSPTEEILCIESVMPGACGGCWAVEMPSLCDEALRPKLVGGGVAFLLAGPEVGKFEEGPNRASNALGVGAVLDAAGGLTARSADPSVLGFRKKGFIEFEPVGLATLRSLVAS